MARHTSPHTTRRALVALATAGVALGAGATTASADNALVGVSSGSLGHIAPEGGQALSGEVHRAADPVAGLGSHALARPAARPAVRPADGDAPLSGLTGPIAQASWLGAIPALEGVGGVLGGGAG
ncbi:hypothetical protein ABZ471_13465 [Streptomyces sp. NPDC005728]|uniref:hypothetical protein n=1 Tax=Streptomyces sp. NPDC005728 TaxID=3157054 RepID=UPI003410A63B